MKSIIFFVSAMAFFPLCLVGKEIENSADDVEIQILAFDGSSGENSSSIQQGRELFQQRCSTCHTLAISRGSDELLPSYWRDTVNAMAAKENSGISSNEIPIIYEYLVYDSAKRRKRRLDEALGELDPGQRQQEQREIDAILRKYR